MRNAFTLVELLVVIVVLGIASYVVLGGIGSDAELRLSAAARSLAARLDYARARAASTGQPHYVIVADDRSTVGFHTHDGSAWQNLTDPVDATPLLTTFPDGPRLTDHTFGGFLILGFDGTGEPFGCSALRVDADPLLEPARFELTQSSRTVVVHVHAVTGRVEIN